MISNKWSKSRKIVFVGIWIGLVINVINYVNPLPNSYIINSVMVIVSGVLVVTWFYYVICDYRNKKGSQSYPSVEDEKK